MQCLTCCCACLRLCHCSSQESAKAKTQKEVIKTLKELKLHLPPEKRHSNKSTTLNTLKYALRCVKQVEGKVDHLSFPLPLVLPCGLIIIVSCSQWGILPATDDQWQSTFWPGCFLLYNWRDRQHHLWIHPQKQCKVLNYFAWRDENDDSEIVLIHFLSCLLYTCQLLLLSHRTSLQ